MTATFSCLHCGGDLGSGDRFCALCGAESLACVSCGQWLLATDQSCPHCGTPAERAVPHETTAEDDPQSPWAEMIERLRRATLGEYDIGRELGRGGMAAVFLAHDISLDRKVAIKVMSPALMMGDGMIERFRHEAITVANLHHPNIVGVYSVRQAEGLHFFVMRYVEGPSLEEVIQRAGRLPLAVVRSILYQVGAALTHAHRAQVIHRDIKPANILIDAEGNAVVTDFGIAKAAERPSRTLTGTLVGTPAYMSPEQCRGVEISGASDQYALGAVAYEMLTGRPPFGGSTLTVMQAHVEQSPAPIAGQCDGCPPEVESAVLRMLAKDPAARWPRLADALVALGAAPLVEDDPHRAELTRLATWSGPSLSGTPTPTSPVPRTRSSGPGEQPGRAVGGISIVPAPAGFEVGDSFLLAAVIRGEHGTRLPPQAVSWSTDAPGVLRVDGAGGMATGVAPGSALLTASCKGIKALLRVEVAPPRADEIVIGPMNDSLHVGDEIRLDATPRDKRGWPISRPVAWESAAPGIAEVAPHGAIVGVATGTVRITAVLDDARASIVIPVLPPRVAVLDVAAPPEAVSAGGSFVLTATPRDRMNAPLAGRATVWSTSDVSVAMVTGEGWVAALRAGSVVLTATCEGVSASVRVTVAPKDSRRERRRGRRSRRLQALGAAAGVAALLLGAALRHQFRARPLAGDVASVPPAMAATTELAAVDSAAPAAVVITQRPPRALRPNATTRLAAEVRDLAGRAVAGAGVEWSSRDSTVVWVNPRTGKARGMRPGQARVTATSGKWRDSTVIAVRPANARPLEAASISIAPIAPLQVGDSTLLDAVVLGPSGDTLAGADVAWSTSDGGVASIESLTGMVRARAPGTAVVLARSGGETTMSEVRVLPAALVSLRILGARPLAVGETLALRADATDARGEELTGRPAVWSSSDSAVAAVDPSSGMVAARAPGTAVIAARFEGKSASVRLTVVERPERVAERVAVPGGTHGGWAEERALAEDRMRSGVNACYGALEARDVAGLATMYRPVTRTDRENLKKLGRILRTREWDAAVGERVNGAQRIGLDAAMMEFSVRLTWKDSFGGRLASEPVFRAEFARTAKGWEMSSCRIVGAPNL